MFGTIKLLPAAAAVAGLVALAGQPAETLRPDALDAPAATSVLDAQRSAEMAQEMAGGEHGGHGGGHENHGSHESHGSPGGAYRHADAGRETEVAPAAPAPASPEHHEHHEHQEQHHEHTGGAAADAKVYVCPMHPEVTSETPGSCSKCGMTLVEKGKE
jgi:hypothetical protein